MALFVSRGKSMKIEMHAESKTYPIYLERGILKKAKEYIGRSGKVFLISDDGVPEQWSKQELRYTAGYSEGNAESSCI